jgi:hypothetical protein
MTQPSIEALASLFREAGSAHHRAFASTNGEDAEWVAWYADYLSPRLEQALGRRFDVRELAGDLRRVDANYRAGEQTLAWPEFYARSFLSGRKRV